MSEPKYATRLAYAAEAERQVRIAGDSIRLEERVTQHIADKLVNYLAGFVPALSEAEIRAALMDAHERAPEIVERGQKVTGAQ